MAETMTEKKNKPANARAEYNKELMSIVEKKTTQWTENIKALAPLLRSKPEDMTDANALAISYRTMMLDEINYFFSELVTESKTLKEMRSHKFVFYSTGLLPDGTRPTGSQMQHPLAGNAKLTKGDKEIIISGDLSDIEQTIDVLKHAIEFLKDSIKTVDQVLYSIKNRLDLFNYLK